jgi:hypothetical protein
MVGMFDMGLQSAVRGSNYDKARTLGNLKLEEAKSLPFDSSDATQQDVKDTFPEAAGTITTYNASGYYQSAWKTVSGPASAEFTGFEYRVEKQYMVKPSQNPALSSENFATSSTATDLIKVTITVRWGNGNAYTIFGLVTA